MLNRKNIKDIYRLSPMQEGIYFHTLLDAGTSAYFSQSTYRIKGVLEAGLLSKSLKLLMERHDALRTVFSHKQTNDILQIVLRERPADFTFIDLRHLSGEASEAYRQSFLEQDRRRNFQLNRDVLIRIAALQLSEQEYELVWSIHHIIMDGWCQHVLLAEFQEIYEALSKGQTPDLGPVVQYRAFIDWLGEQSKEEARQFWKEYLEGLPSPAGIVPNKRRTGEAYRNEEYEVQISLQDSARLRRLGATFQLTPSSLLQAAWALLLGRYNRSKEVAFGVVQSVRPPQIELIEQAVGVFINTVPLRLSIDDKTPFLALAAKMQEQQLLTQPYQFLSLNEIQEQSPLKKELVDHAFIFENFPLAEADAADSKASAVYAGGYYQTHYAFNLVVLPNAEITLKLNFDANALSRAYVEGVGRHLLHLIAQILDHPEAAVGCLELLPDFEKEQLIAKGRNLQSFRTEKTLVDVFHEQAGRHPQAIAIDSGQEQWSYQELDVAASTIAAQLRPYLQSSPCEPVALIAQRSPETIAAILGIWKAGGCYLPVNPEFPADRIRFLLADASARVIVAAEKYTSALSSLGWPILSLEKSLQQEASEGPVGSSVGSSDIAYIIYTSGTSGRPKGVPIRQESMVSRILYHIDHLGTTPGDRVVHMASLSFDASLVEILMGLLAGACVLPVDQSQKENIELLDQLLAEREATTAIFPPAYFRLLDAARWPKLRTLISTGEAIRMDEALELARSRSVFNGYGPTETCVGATFHRVDIQKEKHYRQGGIPIGRPFADTCLYLLDAGGRLVPQGVIGEICISGLGLSPGYIGSPDAAREVFCPNPYAAQTGEERFYRSGDLGRWNEDGELEYLGRMDDQVQIRGIRVEPLEVEGSIRSLEIVQDAAVLAIPLDDYVQLHAFVTGKAGLSAEELRIHLQAVLPHYMLPSRIVVLDSLPLTANGKTDRVRLQEMASAFDAGEEEQSLPLTGEETLLCSIVGQVLGQSGLRPGQDFFHLGGDSIRAIQVVSRLYREGLALDVKTIFTYPRLSDLALRLRPVQMAAEQGLVMGEIPLTPIQREFFSLPLNHPEHFNHAALFFHPDRIAEDHLHQVARQLLNHHDQLRSFFRKTSEGIEQHLADDTLEPRIHTFDLRTVSDPASRRLELCEQIQQGFQLDKAPLMALAQFQEPDGDRLLLVVHHLNMDGISWRILLEDFTFLLQAGTAEKELIALPPKTDSYKKWAEAVKDYANSESFEAELPYWTQLKWTEQQELPLAEKPDPGGLLEKQFALSAGATRQLLTVVHRAYATQTPDVLLTALAAALHDLWALEKVILFLEGHGREAIFPGININRTIGWFTSLYPFCLPCRAGKNNLEDRLLAVKEALREVPNKGMGFGIAKHFRPEAFNQTGVPVPELLFNYLGQFDQPVEEEAGGLREIDEFAGHSVDPEEKPAVPLSINSWVVNGILEFSLRFDTNRFSTNDMEFLQRRLLANLEDLIEHCAGREEVVRSRSDLTIGDLSEQQWKAFQKEFHGRGLRIQDIYPLTPLQEGMLYHALRDPESKAFFFQIAYRLRGHFSADLLEKSFQQLIDRHDVLRTVFDTYTADRSLQIVLQNRPASIGILDRRGMIDSPSVIETFLEEDRSHPFDLGRDLLVRLKVIRISEESFYLVWTSHHILMDGWCFNQLVAEFSQLYADLAQNRPSSLEPVQPYARYLSWLAGRNEQESARYWQQYLSGYERPATLPRPAGVTASGAYQAGEVNMKLTPAQTRRLEAQAGRNRTTVSTLLQACWGVLLSRYNRTRDVVFGRVVTVRPPEVEGVETMAGLFINTLPIRVRYEEQSTFSSLIRRIHEENIQSEPHQYYSTPEIQAGTALRDHLFDHILLYSQLPQAIAAENGEKEEALQPGWELESVSAFEQINYEFSMQATCNEVLAIQFNFNQSTYPQAYIRQVANHFETLIEQVLEDPERLIETVDFLSVSEKEQLFLWSGESRPYPRIPLIAIIREQGRSNPHKIAVVDGDVSWTYAVLDEHVCRLTTALEDLPRGSRVGVYQHRSAESIASLLAIWNAGHVYVPFDPSLPEERLRFQISDSGVSLILSHSCFQESLRGLPLIWIDKPAPEYNHKTVDRGPASTPDAIAYLIYTSGTSGKPKGIPIRQESIADRILYHNEYLGIHSGDRVLHMAGLSFDASLVEIGMALAAGGALVIADAEAKANPSLLIDLLEKEEVTTAIFPPAYLRLLERHPLEHLRNIISTGEAAALEESLFYAKTKKVFNGYGPSETCIGATFHQVDASRRSWYQAAGSIPIGSPFANTYVFVVDSALRLLPPGMPGEICVAGIGLAASYWNREELSREKFVQNPWSGGDQDSLLYRTGDLGQWDENGALFFLGRIDQQVQIRGIRVEVEEIENRLREFPGVQDVLVTPHSDGQAGILLAACYVAPGELPQDQLREHLTRFLPAYMIPASWWWWEQFPLTANGKIDRSRLLARMEEQGRQEFMFQPAQTEEEKAMIAIWEEVLNNRPLGMNDHFFDRGGHSLKAIRLISRIYRTFGHSLTVDEVFQHPTPAALLEALLQVNDKGYSAIPIQEEKPAYPASPAQKRTWILTQFDGAELVYNVPAAFRLRGELQEAALERAIGALARRHEILRTSFRAIDGELMQVIHPFQPEEWLLNKTVITSLQEIESFFEQEFTTAFDLEKGPLFRAQLLELAPDDHLFLFTLHHIVADGWSVQVLFRELAACYQAFVRRELPDLPPLRIQYKDYSVWLTEKLQGNSLESLRSYWKNRFAGGIPVLDFPTDYPRPAVKTYRGSARHFRIDEELTLQLRGLCREQQCSMFVVLLAALKTLLYRYTGQTDLVVGSLIAGREHPDLEHQIGFYANTLPLYTQLDPQASVKNLLEKVRQTTMEAFKNQAYPFDFLVDELPVGRDISRSPLFDVFLSHQKVDLHGEEVSPQMGGLELERFSSSETTAVRFDLEFVFSEFEDDLSASLLFNTDLFHPDTIDRLGGHFTAILKAFSQHAELSLPCISLMGEAEQRTILGTFNPEPTPLPEGQTFLDVFEDQVAKTPDAPALRFEEEIYTYQELNVLADCLAHQLIAGYGLSGEETVAVLMDRSAWLVVSMIAVFKAGGIYLPIDPDLPEERLNYILAQAGARIVLTEAARIAQVPDHTRILIPDQMEVLDRSPQAGLQNRPGASQAAYIIFTSGSTGYPKGVVIEHGGMLNHLKAKVEATHMEETSIVALTASQSFDVSIWQALSALTVGGCTLVYPPDTVKDPLELIRQIDFDEVTVLQVVPSYLSELLTAVETFQLPVRLSYLQCLVVVGEMLHPAVVEAWFRRFFFTKMINHYGPTECSDGVTHYSMVNPPRRATTPIGKPIPNSRVYILDSHQQLCPVGVKGEIYVAGAGVGRGYIGQAEKTAAVFLPDPFFPGGRMYRTGDLGRWLADGNLECFGRCDNQVKIRGHRIELGEIEQALYQIPAVKEAAVLVWTDEQGQSFLCGYLTSKPGHDLDINEIRRQLAVRLPSYMAPSFFFILDSFPTTASRKIDRRQLPRPDLRQREKEKRICEHPASATEALVLEVWQDVLQQEEISTDDHFFEIGGHSFHAIKIQARFFQKTGHSVRIKEIFMYPTIKSFAAFIDQSSEVEEITVAQA